MEEKNEQGPSEIVTAKESPVPTLAELQNYILFLQTRIGRMEHTQIELSARIDRTKSECVETMEKYFQAVEEGGVK
ncbi:hypothetical protein [Ferrovum sp.]|uniref:hypothetical protein n=1 Tax=Ferrovum sp. TaxID=2609467 RepID=UPI00260BD9B1|nr:hypothetical protein [Ferrovum sp.]